MNGVRYIQQHAHLPRSCEWQPRNAVSVYQHGELSSKTKSENGSFVISDEKFLEVLGPSPSIWCILRNDELPLFHEAGVFIPETGDVFVTSNQFVVGNGEKRIHVSRLWRTEKSKTWRYEVLDTDIKLANGAVNFEDGIIFCEQGTLSDRGGLKFMSVRPPYPTKPIITNYHGRWFNSVNGIVVHSDGSIWFTDPQYGYEQHIRPPPELPNQVYRLDPVKGDIRAVAEGIAKPNGLCFSPDEKTLYITDTAGIDGGGDYDPSRASSIFAFDVEERHGAAFIMNKRLFAFVENGVPDGIKCDMYGNVYSGCGNGVYVWSPGAEIIGKIVLPQGHCSNFCFGKNGEMFLLNENRVWHVQLAKTTKGALLRI